MSNVYVAGTRSNNVLITQPCFLLGTLFQNDMSNVYVAGTRSNNVLITQSCFHLGTLFN